MELALRPTYNVGVTVAGNTIVGGSGDDRLSFQGSQSIDFDFQANKVRGLESVTGGAADDHLAGGRDADWFSGGQGADTLDGRAGDDTLVGGGPDADTLTGRSGDDLLVGGGGDDLYDGGKGVDTATFAGAGPLVVDLEAGTASGEGADQLRRIENVNGWTFADAITGDGHANLLDGFNGDDTLSGGGGKDTLKGGAGVDRLDGGAGADVYYFNSDLHSPAATPDVIVDWGKHDVVDLADMDADLTQDFDQAFTVVEGAPAGAPALGVLYIVDNGSEVDLAADVDGDGAYDFLLQVQTDLTVTAADVLA